MCVVFDGSSDKYSNLLLALIRKAQAYGVSVGYTYDANCLRMSEKKFIIREVHIFGLSGDPMQPEEAAMHLSEMCTRYQAHRRALNAWRDRDRK